MSDLKNMPPISRRRALSYCAAAPAVAAGALGSTASSETLTASCALESPDEGVTKVTTTYGPVRGYLSNSVHTFKGIPYGRPPVGALRFKAPLSPEPWTNVRDATTFGPASVQYPLPSEMTVEQARVSGPFATVSPVIFISPMAPDQSEACLVLNVWTQAVRDDRKRPVLFRIHGGGFIAQSAAEKWYDGANLVRRGDIVVVSPNHRLNALGYLYLGEAIGREYAAGNPGMMDLVLALQWVRDNIGKFGGDPDNVTICGESGGGEKVSTLLAMPAAAGLFNRAIVQSGPDATVSHDDAIKYTRRFLANAGVSPGDMDKLQTLPVQTLIKAQLASGGLISPCIDGVTLLQRPVDALAQGMSANVPIIIGTTRDEGRTMHAGNLTQIKEMDQATLEASMSKIFGKHAGVLIQRYKRSWPDASPGQLFILIEAGSFMRRDSWDLAEARLKHGGAPVYMYMIEWESGAFNGQLLAGHGLCAPLTMANTETSGPWTADYPSSRIVSRTMSEAWIAFIRSGDPNAKGCVSWPAYDAASRETMLFDVASRAVKEPYGERKNWDGIPRVAERMFPVPGATQSETLDKLNKG